MIRMRFPQRVEKRRQEAEERQAYRETLSLEQRLSLCDSRPGESKRERERLASQMVKRDVPKSIESKKEPPKEDKKAVKARKRKENE